MYDGEIVSVLPAVEADRQTLGLPMAGSQQALQEPSEEANG